MSDYFLIPINFQAKFDTYYQELNGAIISNQVPPELIFNMDETYV